MLVNFHGLRCFVTFMHNNIIVIITGSNSPVDNLIEIIVITWTHSSTALLGVCTHDDFLNKKDNLSIVKSTAWLLLPLKFFVDKTYLWNPSQICFTQYLQWGGTDCDLNASMFQPHYPCQVNGPLCGCDYQPTKPCLEYMCLGFVFQKICFAHTPRLVRADCKTNSSLIQLQDQSDWVKAPQVYYFCLCSSFLSCQFCLFNCLLVVVFFPGWMSWIPPPLSFRMHH